MTSQGYVIANALGEAAINCLSTDGSGLLSNCFVNVICNHPSSTWQITQEPTYTATGIETQICSICGESIATRIIPVLAPTFTYSLADGAATITGFNGPGGSVIIPAIVDGYPVKRIGSTSITERKDITSVTISEGIEEIGLGAFIGCSNLSSVSLPESLRIIGESAFMNCNIIRIVIPKNVYRIDGNPFCCNSNLESITVENSSPYFVSRYNALYTADLTKIICTEYGYKIGYYEVFAGTKTIGYACFYGDKASIYYTLANGVTKIEAYAFYNCSQLMEVTIPESVVSINKTAFYNCSNVTIKTVQGSYADTFAKENNIPVKYYSIDTVMTKPDLALPSALTIIEDEAFAFNPAGWIKLSDKITTIGYRAFGDCYNLTQIYIPPTATNIHPFAFENVPVGLIIFGEAGSYAETYAANHGYDFRDSDAVLVTQYRYRDSSTAYSDWTWGDWSTAQQTISDPNTMKEESKKQYGWWAAKCSSCGQHNPHWGSDISCKKCGKALSRANITSVYAYSDDTGTTQTILGRTGGRYFDSLPYWRESTSNDRTVYRYAIRTASTVWSEWSAWSAEKPAEQSNREIEERTVYQTPSATTPGTHPTD